MAVCQKTCNISETVRDLTNVVVDQRRRHCRAYRPPYAILIGTKIIDLGRRRCLHSPTQSDCCDIAQSPCNNMAFLFQ